QRDSEASADRRSNEQRQPGAVADQAGSAAMAASTWSSPPSVLAMTRRRSAVVAVSQRTDSTWARVMNSTVTGTGMALSSMAGGGRSSALPGATWMVRAVAAGSEYVDHDVGVAADDEPLLLATGASEPHAASDTAATASAAPRRTDTRRVTAGCRPGCRRAGS